MKLFRSTNIANLHRFLFFAILLPAVLFIGLIFFSIYRNNRDLLLETLKRSALEQSTMVRDQIAAVPPLNAGRYSYIDSEKISNILQSLDDTVVSIKGMAYYNLNTSPPVGGVIKTEGYSSGNISDKAVFLFQKNMRVEYRYVAVDDLVGNDLLTVMMPIGNNIFLHLQFGVGMIDGFIVHELSRMSGPLFLAILLMIVCYIVIRKYLDESIVLPAVRIKSAAMEMQAGIMSGRIAIDGENEIWQIGSAFNVMMEQLSSTIALEKCKVRELNIMNEAVSELSTQTNMDELLVMICRHARNLVKARFSLLLMKDEEHPDRFKYLGCDGYEEDGRFSGFNLDELKMEGVAKRVIMESELVSINGEEATAAECGLPEMHPEIDNLLAVPLISGGNVIGVLSVINKANSSEVDSGDGDLLFTFAIQAMMAIDKTMLFEETRKLSVTDGLTGLLNHREFQNKLELEVERSSRYKRNLSLLLLDIDFFKKLNDTYGHQFGDKVLKQVAGHFLDNLRNVDYAARYGGEEFAIILPETDINWAFSVAERIRTSVENHTFITMDNEEVKVTISLGLGMMPANAVSREELVKAADTALYFAKESGRNKTCRYEEAQKYEVEKIAEGGILDKLEKSLYLKWAKNVENRSEYDKGHSKLVAKCSLALAEKLGMNTVDQESLHVASMLHDIGMISIPDNLLLKPENLSQEERKIIQAHPGLAEIMLSDAADMVEVLPSILYHHERVDGKGYPKGLAGDEIPLSARILAIAEAFTGMTSDRPHRPALSDEDAFNILQQGAGQQFDKRLVEAFIEVMSGKIKAA